MYFIGYDPVGKTMQEVLDDGNDLFGNGVAVYALQTEDDTTGVIQSEDFSLRRILNDHPDLRTARVASHNDYFGESVFRVKKEETK